MNSSIFATIIARIVDDALDSYEEAIANSNDSFYEGRRLAYYEILEFMQSELESNDLDLEEYGLNINLEALNLKNDK